VKFTLQTFAEPIRIRAVNAERLEANCLRCHAELVGEIHSVLAEMSCVRCHAGVGHGPRG